MNNHQIFINRNNRNGVEHLEIFWDKLPTYGRITTNSALDIREISQQAKQMFHCHNFYVLGLTTSEKLIYETPYGIEDIPSGTLIIEHPKVLHRYQNKKYAKDTLFISFSEEVLRHLNSKDAEFFKYDFLLRQQKIVFKNESLLAQFKGVFDEMTSEPQVDGNEEIYIIKQCARLLLIFAIIIQQIKENKPLNDVLLERKKAHHDDIVKFLSLVEQYHTTAEGHHNEYYCNALGISKKTLNKWVCDYMGQTPKYVINKEIITSAKAFLLNTDWSIKNIAEKLGYEESSHFCRFFKKMTGMSALSFKEKIMEL